MRHWYQEVHRRGLWQAAAGYLAAAWVVIEVVDLLTGRGLLPDWVFNGALVLLAIGFPVILATAYVQTADESGSDPGERTAPGSGARSTGSGPGTDGAPASPDARPALSGYLTWRNALLGGMAAFALLGLGTAASSIFRVAGASDADRPALDEDRIAVLPFEVRGSPEIKYLEEGIVDLISSKLDGAGSLSTVDPRVVINLANAAGMGAASPETSRSMAAETGAGLYVTGDLLELGGRIQLNAFLHRTRGEIGDSRQASVEGSAEEVFELIDDLVGQLLAGPMSGSPDRLRALATATSGSLEATKAYLRGEQLMRKGRYRESAAAYDRAIELDSTFALAYYRKSIAADWIDAYDIRSSADRAVVHAHRLSERDRGLLNALHLRRNGRVVEAEQAFRTQLHVYPDDVEALVQLGEALFHDHQRSGRSIMESLVPFERALQLEPANLIALIHVARLYALSGSTDKLAEATRALAEYAPDSERAREVQALSAYVLGDTALQQSLEEQIRGEPWYYRIYNALGVDRFARDPAAAEAIIRARESDEHFLLGMMPVVLIEQGRREEALDFFGQPRLREVPSWQVYEVSVLTSGLVPIDRERLAVLVDRLEAMDPAEFLTSLWLPPYEDVTVEFAAYMRDYYRALALVQLGRIPEARDLLDDMIGREEFIGLGTVKRDAERILEGEILLQAGDRRAALEMLRSVEYEVPHASTVVPMPDQPRSRMLRSELEREFGDLDTAERYLVGLDESWSPWDGMYRSSVYRMMGEIAEATGRPRDAILYYNRLLGLWRDADPDLVSLREEIAARRNALVRATG
jgi:tetratricopeptide (TPR) repeat protein